MARDRRIAGELPLVFFDEFDSSGLVWLKSFLAPMQDGVFRDTAQNHLVDRAILVFAGGTVDTMREFVDQASSGTAFKQAKGPDFVSRLSGYVDVSSIASPSALLEADRSHCISSTLGYQLRRAIVLRRMFEGRYRHLMDQASVFRSMPTCCMPS